MSIRVPRGRRAIAVRATTALVGAAVLAVAGVTGAGAAAATPTAPSASATPSVAKLCSDTPAPGFMACMALRRTNVIEPKAIGPDATPSGYGPSDIQSAYSLDTSGGGGETVAIIDAQDDPNAESDLATYRSTYGLPACTTADGCFTKVNENGATSPLPTGDTGWGGEISLDLDMVSATCPNCNILLVEADQPSTDDLGTAVNTAVSMGAKFVSNSYGGSEDGNESTYDSEYYDHPGVAITASAGDSGYGAEYPATGGYVTAVGGTSLTQDGSARGWSESVWDTSSSEGTGSGCSTDVPQPAFQSDLDTGCANRSEADVSAVADPATGVAVYDTYGESGWQVYGGTSAASPIIASVYALAGTPSSGSQPNSFPYGDTGDLNDVTSGSNGSCDQAVQCNAGTGYDGPTGLGTPDGTAAFSG